MKGGANAALCLGIDTSGTGRNMTARTGQTGKKFATLTTTTRPGRF